MDSKELIRHQVAQAAEKREMMGRPNNESFLIASFRAVELNLNWHVENVRKGVGVLSGFLNCQRFPNTFLFGLRYDKDGVANVSLTILNLHHLGLRVALVRLMCNEGNRFPMKRRNPEKRASKLELFTLEFKQGLDSDCRFNCQVYLEGVDGTYIHQQYDQLLNNQLWTYAQCCCWTDLKFFLGEKVFNAHKFVIYTQSSRLAAEFGQGDSIRLSEDLDPETFKCFLHFLYTGRLMLVLFKTTVCHQLLTLADKYGVETLRKLCQTDLEKLTTETFPEHFMSTGPSATGMMMKPSEIDLRPTSVFSIEPDSTEIRFSWDIDFLPEDQVIKKVIFNHQEMFQVCFRSGCMLEEGKKNPSVFVFGKQWVEGGIDVITVIIGIKRKSSSIDGKTSIIERIPASRWKKVAGLKPAMAIFSADLPNSLSAPFTLIFMIDLSCKSVGNYSYQLRDIKYADSLWSASIHGRFTDVEFVVDGRTFKAHKALMAARSPVFRDLFNSNGMKRESEGIQRVALDDLDSPTFKQVLKFIYTGSLQVSACNPKLFIAADKYQIETLKFLCENQVRQRDRSHQDLFSYLPMVS